MSTAQDEIMNETEIAQFITEKTKEGEMKVTLGQLLDGVGMSPNPNLPPTGPLSRLYGKRFPEGKGSLGYKFKRLMRDVLSEIDTFQPLQKELVEKYGTPSEPKGSFRIEGENFIKYNAEIDAARSTEIVLRHSQMPELRDVWEASPVEDELLSWLVGE